MTFIPRETPIFPSPASAENARFLSYAWRRQVILTTHESPRLGDNTVDTVDGSEILLTS